MPNIGEEVFYIRENGGSIQKALLYGETSRSWLVGSKDAWWARSAERIQEHATKLPKKTTTFRTLEDFELQTWAGNHRWRIKSQIDRLDAAMLKKVAEIIGYEGKER